MKNISSVKRDIIVIGGGASGLFAALMIKSKNNNLSVLVLESSDRVGKKLMVTGNGRCNISNLNLTPEMYHGSFKYAAAEILERNPPNAVADIFLSLGMPVCCEHEGLIYPRTKQANTVVDILRLNAENLGVEIVTSAKASAILSKNGEYLLKTQNSDYLAKKVIVATGGKASPSTGADVSIFETLKALGHTITPLYPSLCPVTVKSPYLKSLKGIRTKAKVSLIKDGKVLKTQSGELQFTENALSGICIFNLSRLANTVLNSEISVDFFEEWTNEEIISYFKQKTVNCLNEADTVSDLLVGVFPKMLSMAILKDAKIPPATFVKDFNNNTLQKLACKIKDFRFKVIPHADFTKAQVTAGGVLGKEIDSHTMESKIRKGMYIIGEATDCDGDCGGANLHFAFLSALACAKDITDAYNK